MRGFPILEFEDRFRKIQQVMVENEIEAILITTESNFHYFSGLVSQFWISPTRPIYLILPAIGETPIAIVSDIMLHAIKDTWIKEVYSWSAPCLQDDGVSLLIDQLKRYDTIGLPMNIESELRMPLKHLLYISDTLHTQFIDVTSMISDLRNVKSELEIQKIEEVCQITSACFEELPERLESLNLDHITERVAVKQMHLLLLERGVDQVKYIVGKSGQGGYHSIVDGPSDRIMRPGSILVIDTGSVYDNYFCDFDRNYFIDDMEGSRDREYIDHMNLILWEATEKAFGVAKPGGTFRDIWWAITDYLESVGLDTRDYQGRMGHCLGLQLTELPSIMKDEYTILKENMVLSVEPFLQLNNEKVLVHEECIVITQDGYRLLTKRCPKKPFTIKVNLTFNPEEVNMYQSLQHTHHVSPETKISLHEFHKKQAECQVFHTGLSPEMTPLLTMEGIPGLRAREIIVKDEGQRLGLKSFKVLGSSFAIHRLKETPRTLCTMTDGNHGKGVAYAAQKMGIPCVIYVPENMSVARQEAMRDLGAEVIVIEGSYDDAISEVRHKSTENQWTLLSDTSWEGYTEIPQDIMAGYGTIFREIEEQRIGCDPITHVIIQAGVGGLASAGGAWLHLNSHSGVWSNHVKLIIVEPLDADCIAVNVIHQQNNIHNKKLISCIGDTNSIMAGLNCGTPSLVSWPILRDIASTFVTIGDNWAKRAMKLMLTQGIISGESGAAGVAAILAAPSLFDEESIILTINTESDTDPDRYQEIIQENIQESTLGDPTFNQTARL